MKIKKELVKLNCIFLCFYWLISPASAQLSDQAKADFLQQEIVKSFEENNIIKADELFKEFTTLGIDIPTPLKLTRAEVSAKLGDFIEAKGYLEQYISTTERGTKAYQEALSMHATIEPKAAAQLAEIRKRDADINRLQAQAKKFRNTSGLKLLPEMVVIPTGNFQMGSMESNDEKPPHAVEVQSFRMSKHETTQGLWSALMGENPSKFQTANKPVETVSWNNVQEFIKRLNEVTGNQYRLPTEAEWEYAALAGSNEKFSWGDTAHPEKANYNNSIGQTTVVGRYEPNQFGLYDMHGNVWEWVQDCYHSSYIGAPVDGKARTQCDSDYHILRGGSWYHPAQSLRAAYRYGDAPAYRFNTFGFRLAQDN